MSSDEEVVIVDSENVAVGKALRSEMRIKKLIHRATYILVFNSNGEVFVQKRTADKDVYPGFYDIAAGGVVLAGEEYIESAERELFEELGISADLKWRFDHFYSDTDNRVWGRVYTCIHDGPFTLQIEEIEEGFFMKPEKVAIFCKDHDFTPDGIEIYRRILHEDMNAESQIDGSKL